MRKINAILSISILLLEASYANDSISSKIFFTGNTTIMVQLFRIKFMSMA
ncbi:MAG: hypothetical protein ACP5PZ_01005 [Bacteroidales bacterium]